MGSDRIEMTDRVAIVSGSSRGIGAAIAKTLAAKGCDVLVHYHNRRDAADEVVRAVENHGRRAIAVKGAIEELSTGPKLVDAALEAFGRLDIVVNNAGTTTHNRPLHESEPADIERLFRINCLGGFALTKAAIPHLRQQPRGDVVFISSSVAKSLRVNLGCYATSKAALEAMAVVMAKELCRISNIHARNIVAPGFTVTELAMANPLATGGLTLEQLDATMPFGRAPRPEDVAAAVAFFCSPECYASGERMQMDGARG